MDYLQEYYEKYYKGDNINSQEFPEYKDLPDKQKKVIKDSLHYATWEVHKRADEFNTEFKKSKIGKFMSKFILK